MGRYVPPEHEGVLNPNQASGKGHALGSRASKPGALTIRFELPFAIWCTSCTPHPAIIGQGVRFNAAKRKVGAYYSSPVYSFVFRHTACGGEIEVRTDPRTTSYVVVRGGRKRDAGEAEKEGDEGGSLVPTGDALLALSRTREEQAEERATAFAKLERTIEDRAVLAAASARIEELEEVAEKQWEDPYARNAALRRAFRVGRREREKRAAGDEEVRERLGLGALELLPENEEDGRRARLVDFGTRPGSEVDGGERQVLARPLFGNDDRALEQTDKRKGKTPKKLKSEIAASKLKDSLVSEIVGNTRMVRDPFLERKSKDTAKSAAVIPGLKRKRDPEREPSAPREERPAEKVASVLVDYDSD